jgi:DNA-binding SARP family transcriptional activator
MDAGRRGLTRRANAAIIAKTGLMARPGQLCRLGGGPVRKPQPPEDEPTGGRAAQSPLQRYSAQNRSTPTQQGAGSTNGTGPANLWLQGNADALLQQALNALIVGDASSAADAARIALARAEGPERDTYKGWSTWLLGLAHLYANDAAGAAPYIQRAHDLALQTQQPTLAMAVYLAQQLVSSYQQQTAMRQHATRLLKQLEEQDVKVTQQFQAMLKFARDSWPAMQGLALPAGGSSALIEGGAEPAPNPLPPLYVQMLGTFRLLAGDREISLRQSRKAADIFKFMLAHRVRPTSKDALLHTVWPDVELKTAAHRLHLAISSLRQMLAGVAPDSPGYIIYRDDAYFFNPLATIDTDVDRFLEAIRNGKALERASRAGEAIAPYEAAVELYHDDYLVENLYDDWTTTARNHLRETYLTVLGRLCDLYWQASRYEDCLQAARKILAKDNYREDGHRYVMACLNALGQRNQALLQYQICEEVLGADLGVAPTAATTDLYRRIKGDE